MEKKPYLFGKGCLETGNKNFPSRYFDFYIISPEKIYFFLTSSHRSIYPGLLGGLVGSTLYELFKWKKDKKNRAGNIEDYEITKELPLELTKKVPKFKDIIVVSKQSVSRLKLQHCYLTLILKNWKWVKINVGIPKKEQLKHYLIKTSWIKLPSP